MMMSLLCIATPVGEPNESAAMLRVAWKRLRTERQVNRVFSTLSFEEVVATSATTIERVQLPVCYILHGLLGQARNWRSFAKRLADRVVLEGGPPWRFILVDLRHHGWSASTYAAPPPSTLDAAAADLERLARATGPPRVVVGHSLGGKVALAYGAAHNSGQPLRVWALDSSPGVVVGDPHGVESILEAVAALPPVLSSRTEAAEMLKGRVPGSIAAWLTSSLIPVASWGRHDAPPSSSGPMRFMFDLRRARAIFEDYKSTCSWHIFESPPAGVDIHMMRASASKSWEMHSSRTRLERLTPSQAKRMHVIHGAGHWLHQTHPEEVMSALLPSLVHPPV